MIRAEDMNLGTGLARCRFCNAVFRLPAELFPAGVPGERGAEADGRTTNRRMVPRPGAVTVSRQDGMLVMDRRWFGAQYVFMAFFSVFWIGFLVFWYSVALRSEAPLAMVLFPLLHVAAGLAMTYGTVAGFVNHTWITVGGGQLTVRHGPLPWWGNRSIPTEQLGQLYCDEVIHRNRNSTTRSFRLLAVLKDGTRAVLAKGLHEADAARFMEWQTEEFLGIEDRPVVGELSK